MYYLGIDGSDRYTKLLVLDENNKILGRHSGACTDITRAPAVSVTQAAVLLVREITRLTNTAVADFGGLCFAASLRAFREHRGSYRKLFKSIDFTCDVKVVNVEKALLAAKIGASPGALVLAGDDVSGYAAGEGTEIFMGNYGTLAETGGSAYSIGLQVLRSVVKTLDGRGAATLLVSKVAAELGVGPADVLKKITAKDLDRKHVYGFAEIARAAAAIGDKAALEIEASAARELADFAESLVKKSADCKNLVLGGAMLLLNGNLMRRTAEILGDRLPDVNILLGDEKAEYGAAMLAKEKGDGK